MLHSSASQESRKTETASTRGILGAEPGVLALPPYSVRNACIGSIRDALQAGTRQASPATASSVAATLAKILGSTGRVPYSIDWIRRTAPAVVASPSTSP